VLPTAVLDEVVSCAVIGEANVEINEGTRKLGLPCAVALAEAAETGGKPTPEAARADTCASSWPDERDDGGTPPGTLVDEVTGRFEACSAARACLTALITDAKKAGEG